VLRSLNRPQRGLYYEKPDRFALFLFAFPFAFESSLSTLLEMQKPVKFDWLFLVDRNIELSNLIWEGLGEIVILEK
jgi:hypothetical protein